MLLPEPAEAIRFIKGRRGDPRRRLVLDAIVAVEVIVQVGLVTRTFETIGKVVGGELRSRSMSQDSRERREQDMARMTFA